MAMHAVRLLCTSGAAACTRVLRPRRGVHSESVYWRLVDSDACRRFLDSAQRDLLAQKTVGGGVATSSTLSYWERVVTARVELDAAHEELEQLEALEADGERGSLGEWSCERTARALAAAADESLQTLIARDRPMLQDTFEEAIAALVAAIVPMDHVDMLNKCQMEFSSGAGGTEAMHFTGELVTMYERLCALRGWSWTLFEAEHGAQGGVRSALAAIDGCRAYAALRFEAGVHRVQRVPATDTSRIHTSTASIVVMPEPEEAQVELPSSDVRFEAMRASGPGGQNVNKRSSAVRLTHLSTGIAVHVMDERFQHQNLQIAYKRLAAILLQQKVDELQSGRTSARRLQVASKARAEKVRTYNFKDDRITDHRLRQSTSCIESFLAAGDGLSRFMEELDRLNTLERLAEIINKG